MKAMLSKCRVENNTEFLKVKIDMYNRKVYIYDGRYHTESERNAHFFPEDQSRRFYFRYKKRVYYAYTI